MVVSEPRDGHWMSIKRTRQTVEQLFRFSMDEHSAQQQARQLQEDANGSDPEVGYKDHPIPHPPQLQALAMQPPRLQGRGCCGRLLTLCACFLCMLVTALAWSALLSTPVMEQTRGIFADLVTTQPPEVPKPKPKPIPAVLRRFALIKRAAAPRKGADALSVQTAFPQWRFPEQTSVDAAVSDLALAIAALVERLDPPPVATRPLSAEPPPIRARRALELEPPNGSSDEDGEL